MLSQNHIIHNTIPARSTMLAAHRMDGVLLEIDDEGGWWLDGEMISPDLLTAALAQSGSPEHIDVILSRDAPAVLLLILLNHAGLAQTSLHLITRNTQSGPPT